MTFLLFIALLLGITIVPVMIGARIVNAQNTGFGSAFIAVLGLVALAAVIESLVSSEALGVLLAMAGGAILLAGILGTSIIRGFAVSVIVVAIQFVVIFAIAGGLLGFTTIST